MLRERKMSLLKRFSLGTQIAFAVVLGIIVAWICKDTSLHAPVLHSMQLLGKLFVEILKAIAPILVFILIIAAIAQKSQPNIQKNHGLRSVLWLYFLGMLLATLVAVAFSFAFPSIIPLEGINAASRPTPSSFVDILTNLLFKIVSNPITAIADANYLSILAWATVLGLTLKSSPAVVKELIHSLADAISAIVRYVIRFSPLGILGLVTATILNTGLQSLWAYLHVLIVIVVAMLFMALIGNPLLVWLKTRRNPYPLVLTCLKESALMAFFLRSSVANIPVNLNLCKKLGLKEEVYSISIPLGATINMEGAAITITVLTLAAVQTMGINVDFFSTFLLVLLAVAGAVGASGVPGGALPLIPMAASLFNINHDIAMQVVAVGLTIIVIQDPCGTALNSSTDVVFTAAADPKYSGKESEV